MSKAAQALLDSALKLSDEERDELIAGLIDSLDDEDTANDETEFHQELRRRIAEVENGTVKTISREIARQMVLEGKDVVPH